MVRRRSRGLESSHRRLDLGIGSGEFEIVVSDQPGQAESSRAGDAPLTSLELVHALVDWLEDKQVADIVVLDIGADSSIADYFLIGTVVNDRHARAIEEDILADFQKQTRVRPQGIEGRPADGSGWHLMDYGDVVLHMFTKDSREHYALEERWKDSRVVLKLL